ncbi:MAG: PKD domain-containing protein, partial [Bacteroidia bacterium]
LGIKSLFLYIVFLLGFSLSLKAQCIVSVNGVTCVNNPIEFESNTPGASNHSWNFNNEGLNNTSSKPVFTFNTTGVKTITYSCVLPNGDPCTTSIQITIKDKPKLRLGFLSPKVQCYDNNLFCIRDSSLSGDNDNCIKSIKYLFSDGELVTKYGSKNNPVSLPSTICKSYDDPQGGAFTLLVEIEDCNGCINKLELPDTMKVELLPSIFANSIESTQKCQGSVDVRFINLSIIQQSKVSKFKWDFGDGTADSTSWDSVKHTYSTGGKLNAVYSPRLIVYTGNGCQQVFNLAEVNVFDINPYIIKNKDSICLGEEIEFKLYPPELQTLIKQEKVRWDLDPGTLYGYDAYNIFNRVGPTIIRCFVSHVCGPYELFDTVIVIGPQAIIEPDFIDKNERYQCSAKDTIHVADHSRFYHNDSNYLNDDSLYSKQAGNLKHAFRINPSTGGYEWIPPYNYNRNDQNVERLWDFDDDYCLPCTTDTKKNQNVGLNCRYSRDSAVQHIYSDWD